MIVLDTNVLSEVMRPLASESVVEWMATIPPPEVFTTALTQAEILYGLALLPEGKRKKALARASDEMFSVDFEGRILPFDAACAGEYARIGADRRRAGRPISQMDAQIAAICRAYGAQLATRNLDDFEGCGINVINPWRAR